MIAVDTNILLYAHRAEMPAHAGALRRMRDLARGPVPFGLPVFCVAEFFRVATHPKVFDPPSRPEIALAAIEAVLAAPTARLLLPGETFPAHFAACARASGASGNLAFDVQIAALCREHGIGDLLTADRDFARFPELTILTLD